MAVKWRDSVVGKLPVIISLLVAIAALYQSCWSGRQVEALESQTMSAHFTASAEMLGSEVIAVRIAGIQALDHLARAQPEQFHLRVTRLLCAFIREPAGGVARPRKLRADVQAALNAVIYRMEQGREIEAQWRSRYTDRRRGGPEPIRIAVVDLSGSDLQWAQLYRADLAHAILDGANLSYASGNGADFSEASLIDTVAHKATFISAGFDSANLLGSNWSDSVLQNSSFVAATMPNQLVVAHLEGADFTRSVFGAANLSGARLDNADLSDARFGTATKVVIQEPGNRVVTTIYPIVTQQAINAAIADPNAPPVLPAGMQDPRTGRTVEWKLEERGDAWKAYRREMYMSGRDHRR